MGRKTEAELSSLCKKYNVDKLYSWSRYHKYKISPYEYFLCYVIRAKADREDSAYAPYGSISHDVLERFYKKQINYEDMIEEFDDGVVTLEIADLKFDRTNEDKNKSIKKKYVDCLRHFFKNHVVIQTKIDIERFIVIKIGKYVFQGYCDVVRKDENENFIIQDWKSSTIYKGQKAIDEAGQLILYAIGLVQLGVPLDRIKICWNFLKYINITISQANGKTTERQIERHEIGISLKSNAKMWLKKYGYSEELDYYLEMLEQTNSIECLPAEVKEKYVINDCYVYIKLTQTMLDELEKDIIKTLDEITSKVSEYKIVENEDLFYDSKEGVEKQSYYFANLCGYSAKLHKPYAAYLEKLQSQKESKDNIFNGIGVSCEEDNELSWLNNL